MKEQHKIVIARTLAKMTTLDKQPVNQEMSSSRIEAFSDGVFAIVITLLVLELRVPEISDTLVSKELLTKLLAMAPKFLSYIASFLTIGIYWVAHHNIFRLLKRTDHVLLWLNLLSLMCFNFAWWYMIYNHRLVDKDLDQRIIHTVTRDYLIGISVYLLPILLSFISNTISIALYVVIPVTYIFLNSRKIYRIAVNHKS